jgi:hypothetical protein
MGAPGGGQQAARRIGGVALLAILFPRPSPGLLNDLGRPGMPGPAQTAQCRQAMGPGTAQHAGGAGLALEGLLASVLQGGGGGGMGEELCPVPQPKQCAAARTRTTVSAAVPFHTEARTSCPRFLLSRPLPVVAIGARASPAKAPLPPPAPHSALKVHSPAQQQRSADCTTALWHCCTTNRAPPALGFLLSSSDGAGGEPASGRSAPRPCVAWLQYPPPRPPPCLDGP